MQTLCAWMQSTEIAWWSCALSTCQNRNNEQFKCPSTINTVSAQNPSQTLSILISYSSYVSPHHHHNWIYTVFQYFIWQELLIIGYCCNRTATSSVTTIDGDGGQDWTKNVNLNCTRCDSIVNTHVSTQRTYKVSVADVKKWFAKPLKSIFFSLCSQKKTKTTTKSSSQQNNNINNSKKNY